MLTAKDLQTAIYLAKITLAVLSGEEPKFRAKILRLWAQTLRSFRVEVFPEADHVADLICWLEAIADSL